LSSILTSWPLRSFLPFSAFPCISMVRRYLSLLLYMRKTFLFFIPSRLLNFIVSSLTMLSQLFLSNFKMIHLLFVLYPSFISQFEIGVFYSLVSYKFVCIFMLLRVILII
jgi:hypothetical protein